MINIVPSLQKFNMIWNKYKYTDSSDEYSVKLDQEAKKKKHFDSYENIPKLYINNTHSSKSMVRCKKHRDHHRKHSIENNAGFISTTKVRTKHGLELFNKNLENHKNNQILLNTWNVSFCISNWFQDNDELWFELNSTQEYNGKISIPPSLLTTQS